MFPAGEPPRDLSPYGSSRAMASTSSTLDNFGEDAQDVLTGIGKMRSFADTHNAAVAGLASYLHGVTETEKVIVVALALFTQQST